MAVQVKWNPRKTRAHILEYIGGLLVPSRYWEVSANAEVRDVPVTVLNDDGYEKLEPTGWVDISIRVGPKGSAPPFGLKSPRRKRKAGRK